MVGGRESFPAILEGGAGFRSSNKVGTTGMRPCRSTTLNCHETTPELFSPPKDIRCLGQDVRPNKR